MPRPLVIIHGWSDHAKSFQPLAGRLGAALQRTAPHVISLADYISLDDAVTFDDLVAAMQVAWHQHQLPTTPDSVDVVVHSTGALILRHWLVEHYPAAQAPVGNLLMLAPANFGSALAHKGRAFMGRIFKGLGHGRPFEVGAELLRGLELASPYTWQLAERDLFSQHATFHAQGVRTTVLIGNHGYTGLAAAANEVGSDGTVRIASANLNATRIIADYHSDPERVTHRVEAANADTAFGVIAGLNHRAIIDAGMRDDHFELLCRALTVSAEGFAEWQGELAAANANLLVIGEGEPVSHGYQNTIFRVNNQFDQPVPDYFLEFTESRQHDHWFAEHFHDQVLSNVHRYQADPSYRCLYLNATALQQHPKPWQQLHIALTAFPQITDPHNRVGYHSLDQVLGAGLQFAKTDIDQFLQPNRTVLVNVTIRREQAEKVFAVL